MVNVIQVSIIPRTNKMLGFSQYMPEERKLLSQDAVSIAISSSLLNLSCFCSFLCIALSVDILAHIANIATSVKCRQLLQLQFDMFCLSVCCLLQKQLN